MRRLFASVALAAALLLWLAPAASANQEWCSDDPPRVLATPEGRAVAVYETLGAPSDAYLADLTQGLAATTYTAADATRGGVEGTTFTLTVAIPSDPVTGAFPTQGLVSALPFGAGTRYASATGTSGAPLVLRFWYPLP